MSAVTKQIFCANELPSGTPLKVQYQDGNPFYALVVGATFDKMEITYVSYNNKESYGDPSLPIGWYPEVDTISISSIENETVKIETIL